jgi:ribosome biogenesis GTPase A
MLDEFREKKLEVIAVLGELCDLSTRLGARSLAERLDHDVVQKLEADRFHLVVVGEFNHGKTTFVNALLGSAVLPIGVTPTTAVIHHIVHAETPRARVVTTSGDEREIPFEQVTAFTAEGSDAREEVRYLEVGYPAELLRERLVLVDTPGVNDLSLTRAEITYGYIPRSDAVLFVLDAGQPVKESERQFLETQLIGKSREKIVFVVAKSDIWSEEEKAQALAYIRDRLGRLLTDAPIFAISAQAALQGRQAESGLPDLSEYLNRFLAEQRGRLVLRNGLLDGSGATSVLARGIDARRRAATLGSEQLGRRVELLEADLAGHAGTVEKRRLNIREQAGAIKAWARRDLDRFCDDVAAQLPAALEKASGDDVRQHLGAFLEQSFREWASAETREIGVALEQLAEQTVAMVREDAQVVGKRVGDAMGSELSAPSIEVDTFAQDVSVFAVLSLGMGMLFANALLGGLLLAAAPVLAMYNRGRTEQMLKKRALEIAPMVLREASAKVAPKIDEMVDDFASRLDAWVIETGQELHREVIEVLQNVRKQRTEALPDTEGELKSCDRFAEQLVELKNRLAELHQSIVGAPLPGAPTAADAAAASEASSEDEPSRVVERAVGAPTNGAGGGFSGPA